MSETKGAGPEITVNSPDLSGKRDILSRFARGIQQALGIEPKPGVGSTTSPAPTPKPPAGK